MYILDIYILVYLLEFLFNNILTMKDSMQEN